MSRRTAFQQIQIFMLNVLFPLSCIAQQGGSPAVQNSDPQQGGQATPGSDGNNHPGPDNPGTENPDLGHVFSRGLVLPDDWNPSDDKPLPGPAPAAAEPAGPGEPAQPVETDGWDLPLQAPPYGEKEDEISRRAWRYFAASREARTGLYDSVLHYPATTMWDVGSSIAALVSAEKLGLLSPSSFQLQIRQLLKSLARMPLYRNELPNREYNSRTLELLDHRSTPSNSGSGWSALDIGRLLIWLRIVWTWYPDLRESCEGAVNRWHFDRLRLNGESNGTLFEKGREHLRQEGRLGYEQYAARGFAFWGVDLPTASAYAHAQPVEILGVTLLRDDRSHAFLTGDPFFLARLEVGSVDPVFDGLGSAIFEVEQHRWQQTGILTAMSEDGIDVEPWFVYNTIFYNDKPLQCVSPTGKNYGQLKAFSTKAAMAYAALHDDAYGRSLENAAEELVDPRYGYYSGKYESGGRNRSLNVNTNAVVLEAMLYRKLGRRPFLRIPEVDERQAEGPGGAKQPL